MPWHESMAILLIAGEHNPKNSDKTDITAQTDPLEEVCILVNTMKILKGKARDIFKIVRVKTEQSNRLFNIRNKLITAFSITVIPIVLLGLFSYNKASEKIQETSKQTSLETIKQTNKYLHLSFTNIENISKQLFMDKSFMDLIVLDSDASPIDTNQIQKIVKESIEGMVFGDSYISGVSIVLQNNKSISSSGTTLNKVSYESFSNSQLLNGIREKEGQSAWVGYRSELDEVIQSNYAYAISKMKLIKDSSTRERGILVIDIKPQLVEDALDNINLGDNSEIHLISPDGRDIAFKTLQDESELLDTSVGENQITGTEIFSNILSNGGSEGSFLGHYKGNEHLVLFSEIGQTGYVLIGLLPTGNFLASARDIRSITLVFTIIAAFIAIAVGLFMAVGMHRTISRIITASNKAANGDLTVTFSSRRRDELGTLTKSIGTMIANMRQLIQNTGDAAIRVRDSSKTVSNISNQVSIVSQEVAKTIQEIAEGASNQAEDSEQGARRMTDLSLKINGVSESAAIIGSYSEDTIKLTKKGLESVEDLEKKARETTEITKAIITDIQTLDSHSKSIDKVVKVIGSIADQTNLLSLNAAIEAARAGEAGKGFAVVADEVRKLSEQSTLATGEIAAMIKSIRNHTTTVVEKAVSSGNILASQNEAVANTLGIFKRISDSMEALAHKVTDIMAGVTDMNRYRDQTISSIDSISAVSEQIAAATQEVSASTEEQVSSIEELAVFAKQLDDTAKVLNDAISRFKV